MLRRHQTNFLAKHPAVRTTFVSHREPPSRLRHGPPGAPAAARLAGTPCGPHAQTQPRSHGDAQAQLQTHTHAHRQPHTNNCMNHAHKQNHRSPHAETNAQHRTDKHSRTLANRDTQQITDTQTLGHTACACSEPALRVKSPCPVQIARFRLARLFQGGRPWHPRFEPHPLICAPSAPLRVHLLQQHCSGAPSCACSTGDEMFSAWAGSFRTLATSRILN